jgi:hypothetical protein
MKTRLAAVMLGAVVLLQMGCATPAYTTQERYQMIARNIRHEWAQAQDDIDHVLLLRPASKMTVWHATVQQRE